MAAVVPASAQSRPEPTNAPVITVRGFSFALSVPDLDASVRWYSEKLGLRQVMRQPRNDQTRAAVVVLEGGGLTVELVKHDDAKPSSRAPGPETSHGIFKVGLTVDDFDATLATLRARGVEIAMGPWPKRSDQPANVMIRDNAGTLIQIVGR